jgi:hypothetical protein
MRPGFTITHQNHKQQSKQWTEAGCSAPKKTSSVPSAGKVMASVVWDAKGILFIDYLEKGNTITREYYSNLLNSLGGGGKPSFIKTMHSPTSVLAMGKLRDLHYELLENPPSSPDLAPTDLSLPKTQTLPRWSAFFFESRGDCSCRRVFCGSYEEPLQGRDIGTGASLE